MPVSVYARHHRPTHHISLTDKQGRRLGIVVVNSRGEPDPTGIDISPIDRTAMKTTSGATKYSDFDPPYSPIVQDNWVGGRGQTEFERDVSRYSDGFRAITHKENYCYMGGQETYTSVASNWASAIQAMPGNVTWHQLVGPKRYLARSFTETSTANFTHVWIMVARRGKPNSDLIVRLRQDNGGVPGTVQDTITTLAAANVPDTLSEWRIFTLSTPFSLHPLTTYWIEVFGSASDNAKNHWRVGVTTEAGTGSKLSSDGTTWTAAKNNLYYRFFAQASKSMKDSIFFTYKESLYMVKGDKLYANGDRGAADSNTGNLSKLIDATKSWTTNQWAGCTVKITNGPGQRADINYRTIVSNTATQLVVDSDWDLAHTTSTEYVILGSNTWKYKSTVTLGDVTSVCVSPKGIVYFAQGDSLVIRRWRGYNNAGTWTEEDADDGTNKAVHLKIASNLIWRGQNDDATGECSVSSASTAAWGTNLTFGTVVIAGLNAARITGLENYQDESGLETLWVLKENEIAYLLKSGSSYLYTPVQLREIQTVSSPKNGLAHTVFNTYLYLSLLNGLEQYYREELTDMGPNTSDGLPASRQGNIVSLVPYPGRLLAAIDAGANKYSSVMAYANGGWYEIYRAPKGQRIYSMYFEALPGDVLDRLWIGQGADIIWLPFPSGTTNPLADATYKYTHEMALTLSVMTAGMADSMKFIKSIKIGAENMSSSVICEIDYRLDDDVTWTTMTNVITQSPSQEIDLTPQFGLSAKKIQFRLRFQTNLASTTPILHLVLIEALTRIPNKFAYSIPFAFQDNGLDLQGNRDDYRQGLDKIDLLNTWATESMVLMRSTDPSLDNKLVFCLPVPTKALIVSTNNEKLTHYGRLVVQDA